MQKAADLGFHEIRFAVPLLAFSLEALVGKRFRPALVWALPLLLVKEDLGVTVTAIGFLVLLAARHTQPRLAPWAAVVMAAGTLGAIVIVTLVIPAFNATGHYDYTSKIETGATIPAATAVHTLLWILLPTTGLLALRSPILLAALPTTAWRFLSGDDHYWGTDWHYSAILMPIVFTALTDSLTTARRSPRAWLSSYARHLPAAAAAAALALSIGLPVARLTQTAT
ncbi:DUF2079 domain-containing protein [Streptomyces erythrochromogenes]|uniref:DUF2079 domain-containing protein n=1 Tax=Streptomyces erythrochromogenes TaxID=285574 RepID=UPI0034470C79